MSGGALEKSSKRRFGQQLMHPQRTTASGETIKEITGEDNGCGADEISAVLSDHWLAIICLRTPSLRVAPESRQVGVVRVAVARSDVASVRLPVVHLLTDLLLPVVPDFLCSKRPVMSLLHQSIHASLRSQTSGTASGAPSQSSPPSSRLRRCSASRRKSSNIAGGRPLPPRLGPEGHFLLPAFSTPLTVSLKL